MAQVPVDLTGITVGQTLTWDGTKLIPGDRAQASLTKTGTTRAELGTGSADGDPAVLRIAGHEELLYWDSGLGKWVGEQRPLITQQDSWAMDVGNRSGAAMIDWSPVDNAVPFGKSHALLTASVDLSAAAFAGGTGVIVCDDLTSPHSFPFQAAGAAGAYLQIRDNYITYTGRSGTQFNGCTVVQGSKGTIPAGEYAVQGYPGGWGVVATPVPYASAMWAAGFQLQERLTSMMNSGPGDVKIHIAPYWYEYDPGDGTQPPALPMTGGLGVSASLASLTGSGVTVGSTGERAFKLTVPTVGDGWTDWPLAAPSKQTLVPRLVAKMDAAGLVSSGELLDTMLVTRWVG